MKLLKERGFALIELLVVIAIIGVLATVVISSLSSAKNQATDKRMQKMLHNLQIKLEVYHLDNSEYPRGTFLSYREAEMVQLASLLDVDPNDLYPCGKFGQDGSCSSWYVYDSLMYQEPRPDPKCWKNHYVITYFILNPTAPFEPPQDYPCGSYSLLGDDIPDFCTDGIEEDWEQWFCDDSWARNFNLIIK